MYINLNSIEVFAYHGAYEEEAKNGNHFEIDLHVEVPDSRGMITDRLEDALDYTKLLSAVLSVSESKRFILLEAFASNIGEKILDEFREVKNITIKIRKLNPPMNASVKNVE